MKRRAWISRPFVAAALALGILFVLLLTAVTRLAINEKSLAGAPAEGVIWFASQAQYEAMRLADSVLLFELGRVTADEVRLRFDLLDSRLRLFEEGDMTTRVADLAYDDEVASVRTMLEGQRAALSNLAPVNIEAVTALHDTAATAALVMRDFANAGMLDGRDRQGAVRNSRRQILVEIMGYLLATVAAGILVTIIVVRGLRMTMRAQAALKHEREVSRLHRAFASVVSHQFRTPLSIIDASAQRMLRRGGAMSEDEIVTRVTKIRNACQRLTRLMQSTLNAARLEQGEVAFNAHPSDLHQMLATLRDTQPDEDQVRIEIEIGTLPRIALVDAPLLEQAVHNLVSNALKYSTVDQPVRVRGAEQDGDVVISVEDRGIGIPQDEIGFISERFFRARTAQAVTGTGIGLSFASQIMELHGGRVEIESVEGQGSTFTLRFPYRRGDSGAKPGSREAQAA